MSDDAADPIMDRILAQVALPRAEAAAGFAELWDEIGADGDPLHRCALAHHAADVQDNPRAELVWDQRALDAADALTDDRAQRYHASLQVASFYPSLHLNLAEVHRRLGDVAAARSHLAQAGTHLGALPADGYGAAIGSALDRVQADLDR